MKISTGRGDKGVSSLADGKPLLKSDAPFEVMGDLDELSAALGLCLAGGGDENFIRNSQNLLINIMSYIASGCNEKYLISKDEAESFYSCYEYEFNGFVLPGGNELSARFDFARTVARRAERHFVSYITEKGKETEAANFLIFLNRLSDALFIEARKAK